MSKKLRTRPTTGYALLSVTGAVATALLVLLSPLALAASVGTTLHPRYTGLVNPFGYDALSGCGRESAAHTWHLSLKSGRGHAASQGKAGACSKSVGGSDSYSESVSSAGLTALIVLPALSSRTTNISAKVSAGWTTQLDASAARSTGCSPSLGTTTYTYLDWGWNYTSSGGFGNNAYLDNYSYVGPPANASSYVASNLSTIPTPFSINSTTLLSIDYGFYVYGECESVAQAYLGTWGYVYDLTTGGVAYESGDSVGTLYDAEVEVYNLTYYGCFADFYWNGPAGVTYGNTTYVCYNANSTTRWTSFTYVATPATYYVSGTNSSQFWTNPGFASGTIWFNGPFNGTDRYALALSFYSQEWAYNSWSKGYAAWDFNMHSGGLAFKLNSIKIS